MKGHTVPWAFLPDWIQAILALVLIAVIARNTYNNPIVVRRYWPWVSAVSWVLLMPVAMRWLGFGPQGIGAKTLAAELQSLSSTGVPWLKELMSTLQFVSTKGMGLKTAGVIFMAGGTFGRLLILRAYNQLCVMGYIQPQAEAGDKQNGRLEANQHQGDLLAEEQQNQRAQLAQQPIIQHDHND